MPRLSLLSFFIGTLVCLAPGTFAQRGDAPTTSLRAPAEQRALFHLPPGFEIQLVASEPEIQKPLNLAFDSAGRLWVTGSTLYPWPAQRDALGAPIATFAKHWDENHLAFRAASAPPEPAQRGLDTVRILSDFGPDGRARQSTVFADGLNIPIGVLPLPRAAGAKGDTALVFSIPAIWRLTDTDGDGRADVREKLYDGFGFKDTHGMSSNYWLWLDGWVYGTHGFANVSDVVDRAGRSVTLNSGNTYRFRPDGSRFEIVAHGQTNPFGLAFDARGDLYTADSHSKPVYLLLPGGSYEGLGKTHDGLGFGPAITSDDHGSSAIAGIAHYSATQFPVEFYDNLFNGNPVTRRINRTRLEWRGSTPNASRQPDFLTSDDPAFRPVQVKLGPDGALWIADFYNPIIGHYEVPLTHPSRDRTHGRIWRIVWRGLDGSVPAPTLPDLTRLALPELAPRLSDSNLVVRSLALAELLARPDAASTAPALHLAAARLVAATDAAADGTAALPLFFALERLGHADDALLFSALTRPDSEPALAALRVLAARDALPAAAEAALAALAAPTPSTPGQSGRSLALLLARHSQPWAAPLLLSLFAKVPDSDPQLLYALRLALKNQALAADAATLLGWSKATPAAAERVADVCLAVPTPAAAEFLLGYLERGKFAHARAGDFARHAVLQLPSDQISTVLPLLHTLGSASLAQRFALAEGLALVAAKPARSLPPEVAVWMQEALLATLAGEDQALVLRAINALAPLPLPTKSVPLRRLAFDVKTRDPNRAAALRALSSAAGDTEEILVTAVATAGPNLVRRAAADLLGNRPTSPAARAALASSFGNASADLALSLATALAKSDDGATALLDLAATGRVRPSLLRHRHLELAFAQRPAALRARVAALTQGLPPEDARLDALVAQRVIASYTVKGDATRGSALFATHCAACHRLRDTGGNLGPSLDGLSARSVPRLIEDILDPSRNIDPMFRLTTATLKNGETKAGFNRRDESALVRLTDPANGQDFELSRSDVTDLTNSPVSPMPAGFESVLTEQEFFNLLEFLRTPPPAT